MLRRKFLSFVLCLLFILALFRANHILFQTSMDTPSLMEQEETDKEKGMDVFGDRGTRSPPGWSNEIRLTNSPGDSSTPDMAVWGSNVHVVWSDDRDGNYEIFYKKSVDNGLNWSNDIQLTFTNTNQLAPKIAVYGTNIHIVWYESYITYYRNSTDDGKSWGSITMWDWTSYPPSPVGEGPILPDIAVSGSSIYVVAFAYVIDDIIFKRSSDNGDTWINWILVNEFGWMWDFTSIETDGSLIHIMHETNAGISDSLWHYYSQDQGDTWFEYMFNPVVLADSSVGDLLVSFATSMQGNLFQLAYSYCDGSSGNLIRIYTKYWNASQSPSWSLPYEVGTSEECWAYVDIDYDHIIWNGYDENSTYQLYSYKYGQITDYVNNSFGWTIGPTIACSGNIIHVIWVDTRDGNNELYYTQRGLFADLVLSNSDIQLDPPTPVVNSTIIYINGTVFSFGKSTSNIEVKFYIGDPDTNNDLIPDPTAVEIGNDTININKDSSELASIQWLPPSIGTYNIFVWVDPKNNTQEYNYTNNLVNITLEVVPGFFSMTLVEGWNLISIPLELSENNLISLLQPIQGQYDGVQWYNLTDTKDPWKHYHISKPSYLNDLKYVDQYIGIWLHVTEPGGTTLTIIDNNIETPQNVSIYPGWNLVGYPSLTSYNRTEGLNNLTFGSEVISIWTYNSTTQKWKELGPLDYFEIGRGYWIYAENKCTWEVPL